MKEANDELNSLEVVKDLGQSIGDRLLQMVGPNQAVDTELAAAPDDPMRLIRGMRIYVDGDAHRDLGRASLGTLNVLYLALHELGLDASLLEGSDIAHVVWAIEEPEAHLHPHLQRLIFGRLLGERSHPHTTLVTTQSPYIASVADPKSLVVLRTSHGSTTVATAHDADLSADEWADIARYLDATRAELVFARRVLLVEGFAEQVMVPKLAAAIRLDLDKLGISVCAIHGTHFRTYVQFCKALGIPWAVITDGDVDSAGVSKGQRRADDLLALLGKAGDPAEHGIFVGDRTFEYDVLKQDKNLSACFDVLKELCAAPSVSTIESWKDEDPGYGSFMAMIDNAGGKGRYAQRLALQDVEAPRYLVDALDYLGQQ